MQQHDITAVAAYCRSVLNLADAKLGDEHHYQSLPLCVIDTIYSINANYTSTRNTVIRFCNHFGLKRIAQVVPPPPAEQLSVSKFINIYDTYGVTAMAENVFQNKQRTSTRSGILKAEAVLLLSKVLRGFDVDYFQDVAKVLGRPVFEQAVQRIPGQASGVSLRYFYMLAGSDDFIKPDRMIARFVHAAINRPTSIGETHSLIVEACRLLVSDYPHLTPKLLDFVIWNYQRTR